MYNFLKGLFMLDLLFILFIVFCFLIYKNIKDTEFKYINFYLLILFLIYFSSIGYLYSLI